MKAFSLRFPEDRNAGTEMKLENRNALERLRYQNETLSAHCLAIRPFRSDYE